MRSPLPRDWLGSTRFATPSSAHLERGVFPGGCFFVSAAIELDAKDGPIRDHLREVYAELVDGFGAQIRRAQELGELDAAADPAQILFELDSFLLCANMALRLLRR